MRKSAGAFLSILAVIASLAYLGLSAPRKVIAETPLPPARRTRAPGEGGCSCHNGSAASANGTLSLLGLPSSYVPGTVYTLGVQLQDPGQSRWGFEATVLMDSDHSMAGGCVSMDGTTGIQMASGKTYVSHNSEGGPGGTVDGTFAGTANGPVSWSFQWTAPVATTGPVTIYVTAVAADNDLDAGGTDYEYQTSASIPEEVPSPVREFTWGQIKNLFPN